MHRQGNREEREAREGRWGSSCGHRVARTVLNHAGNAITTVTLHREMTLFCEVTLHCEVSLPCEECIPRHAMTLPAGESAWRGRVHGGGECMAG